jgi:hypothetical protein
MAMQPDDAELRAAQLRETEAAERDHPPGPPTSPEESSYEDARGEKIPGEQ